jgi:hypothetical protein
MRQSDFITEVDKRIKRLRDALDRRSAHIEAMYMVAYPDMTILDDIVDDVSYDVLPGIAEANKSGAAEGKGDSKAPKTG